MNNTNTPRVKASQHESHTTFSIIAFLLPVVGIVLGVVYLTKDNRLDKKLGEHTLALSILFLVLWGVGLTIYNAAVATGF